MFHNISDLLFNPWHSNESITTRELHDINMWQPPFQQNVMKASDILSYLSSIFLILMFFFVVIKTTASHGMGIWILHKAGNTKFPKRPEIIVIFCSTLPTLLTIQSRSAMQHYHNITIDIGYRWGSCQTVLFLDMFARTAGLYHMLYWTFSRPLNQLLWRFSLHCGGREPSSGARALFNLHCKRRLPGLIYLLAFVVSVPILIVAEKAMEPHLKIEVCVKIPAFVFYHYYDLVMLIALPTVLMVFRFYSSALDNDKRNKMLYRLRCYHVTFVLLSVPILVLNIVYEIFTALHSSDLRHTRFANGIIISMTAYHTSFLIRPLVYTTGCNCICCGDQCLLRYPRVNRWVIYWSLPQHKNKASAFSQSIQVTID